MLERSSFGKLISEVRTVRSKGLYMRRDVTITPPFFVDHLTIKYLRSEKKKKKRRKKLAAII